MDSLSCFMLITFIVGLVTISVCLSSLLHDNRKHRKAVRERRRSHMSENTSKTILAYTARQENEATYYRHRA